MEKEDIKKILEQFMESEQAEQAADDIYSGERLLSQQPGPEPDEAALENIKSTLSIRLAAKETNRKRFQIVFKAAAVAAILAIMSLVGTFLLDTSSPQPRQAAGTIKSQVPWESEDIYAVDDTTAIYEDEIQQIRIEVMEAELGEDEYLARRELLDIERELIAVAGDFWER